MPLDNPADALALRQKQRIRRRRFGVAAPVGLASDTFTRGDSNSSLGTADTGQVWVAQSGTWGITGGAAYGVTHANGNSATLPLSSAAGSVSALVTTDAIQTHSIALYLRYVDASNFLVATYASGSLQVSSDTAGSIVTATATAAQAGLPTTGAASFTCTFSISGSAVTAAINGVHIAAVDTTLTAPMLTAFGASKNVGLRMSASGGTVTAATVDNFTVTM